MLRETARRVIRKFYGLTYDCWIRIPPRIRCEYLRLRSGQVDEAVFQQIADHFARLLNEAQEPTILFLPMISYFDCGFQRPHQLARGFAAVNCPTIYSEPWSFAGLAATPDAESERGFVGLREIDRNLYLLRLPQHSLHRLLRAHRCDAVVVSTPYQADQRPEQLASHIYFEVIDDSSLSRRLPWWWRGEHRRLTQRAAVVGASADDLAMQLRKTRPDTVLVPNGVWLDDWRNAQAVPCPESLQTARRAETVVIYYGAIARWFDWKLWEAAARRFPHWSFVLIGFPYEDETNETINRRLEYFPNMYFLGPKPYAELPRYMQHADIATIPFTLSELTHAVSPVKLFEYLAAGKPVVATPMREILKYSSVLCGASPDEFCQQLQRAHELRHDPDYLKTAAREATENTWQMRATILRTAFRKLCKHTLAPSTTASGATLDSTEHETG